MPVRIKRPEVKKSDIAFRKWALAAFLSAAVFGTVFAALINTILDAGKAVPTTILFCAYVIYLVMTALAAWKGISAYAREDVGAALFQGLLLCFSAICALVNMRLAIVMLLEAYGKSESAEKLMGEQSTSEFIASQRTPWIMLAIGMALGIAVGVLAIVKLASSKKDK